MPPALDWATVLQPLAQSWRMRCTFDISSRRRRCSGRHPADRRPPQQPSHASTAAAHAGRQARHPGHLHVPDDHAAAAARGARGKDVLTPEEAAAFEASENLRLNRDLYDPEKGQPSAGYPPRSQGGVLSYNDFWYERGNQLVEDKRTSLIVDPPDGRIPLRAAQRRAAGTRAPAATTLPRTSASPTAACSGSTPARR